VRITATGRPDLPIPDLVGSSPPKPLASALRRPIVRRPYAIVVSAATAVLLLLTIAFTHAGTWLVVADPLQPSGAIVVFGGAVPFRAMEAAAVYKQGWAPEVWMTSGGADNEDLALARLGIIRPSEHVYNQQVLERLGVPHDAIRLLPGSNVNTAAEVSAVGAALEAAGKTRAILVTSKYHTRRVKTLWRALVSNHLEAIVRYTTDEPAVPERWWHTTKDAMAVWREWFALANAKIGFPMKNERE
jgi:uncharacterized SAM-binding protein YcdF (DUF218 family)